MSVCASCGTTDNPTRARFCLECGAPLSTTPAEERRVVTILFVDLVGFTQRSDQADPEDVRRVLVPFHTLVKRELERFGGTLDKFIGDAVMGVFGAPVAHEDDPVRAVRAGLEVLRSVDRLRQADPDLSVRIAVNTGEAMVAFGTGPQVGEAVAGDVVNTASRMQALAPRDGLVVGEATLRALGGGFDARMLPPAAVKGKAEPLTVWRILREGTGPAPGLDSAPFVGRTAELSRLSGIFEQAAQESDVHVVTMVGEPGIGKSRLGAELRARLEGEVRWLAGRCLPYGDAVTFAAVADTVRQVAGIDPGDDPDRIQERLAALAGRVAPGRADTAWLASRLLQVLGVGGAEDQERSEPTPPEELAQAWGQVVVAGAEGGPVAVTVEDMQWAEPVLVDVVASLEGALRGHPAVVLCTGRPEILDRSGPWAGDGPTRHLMRLAPLSPAESSSLVEDLMGGTIGETERSSVVERSGGNPLFAVELARMLQEQGNGPAPGSSSVPHTVQAVIGARLDALPPEGRLVVQDAAVIGPSFWPGAVAFMAERDPETVADAVADLIRRGLVARSERSSLDPEPEYAFAHGMIREVAYGRLPRDARARRHLSAGTWLELASGDRADERAEVLARHFAVAVELAEAAGAADVAEGARTPALTWLMRAGERLRPVGAAGAFALFDWAVGLSPPGTRERAEALLWSARMGRFSGRIDGMEIERRYEEALELFGGLGDEAAVGATLTRLGAHAGAMGDPERSRHLLARSMEVLEGLPPGPDLARAYAYQAEDRMFAGHIDESFDFADRALRLISPAPQDEVAVMALHIRGDARCGMGDHGGLEDLEQALRLAEAGGNVADIVTSRDYLAEWLWILDRPDVALPHIEAGLELAERRGQVSQGQWTKAGGLGMLFDLGRWDEALAWGEELLAPGRDRVDDSVYAVVRTTRARILHHRGGDDDPGTPKELLALAGSVAELQARAPALATAAEIALTRGQSDVAAECLHRFDETTRGVASQYREGELAAVVRTCVGLGELGLAQRLVGESRGLAKRDRLNLDSARAVLAEARSEPGAAGLHARAAEGWAAFGCPFEQAMSLLGESRCGTARPDSASRARELLARLGVRAA